MQIVRLKYSKILEFFWLFLVKIFRRKLIFNLRLDLSTDIPPYFGSIAVQIFIMVIVGVILSYMMIINDMVN